METQPVVNYVPAGRVWGALRDHVVGSYKKHPARCLRRLA